MIRSRCSRSASRGVHSGRAGVVRMMVDTGRTVMPFQPHGRRHTAVHFQSVHPDRSIRRRQPDLPRRLAQRTPDRGYLRLKTRRPPLSRTPELQTKPNTTPTDNQGTARRPEWSFCRRRPDETIFRTDEAGVKRRCAKVRAIKQRGSVMLDIIISLFYRQSCKASLSAIRTHKHLFD